MVWFLALFRVWILRWKIGPVELCNIRVGCCILFFSVHFVSQSACHHSKCLSFFHASKGDWKSFKKPVNLRNPYHVSSYNSWTGSVNSNPLNLSVTLSLQRLPPILLLHLVRILPFPLVRTPHNPEILSRYTVSRWLPNQCCILAAEASRMDYHLFSTFFSQ